MIRIVVLVLAMCASTAHAQPDDRISNEASSHFEAGLALVKRGNHAAALAEFEKAYALVPKWELLFNIGVTQRTLFRYGAAIKTMERYLAEGGANVAADRRSRVEAEIAELRKLVGEVAVTVDGAPARIEIDGAFEGDTPLSAPLLVAPGAHVIRASRTGERSDQRTITVVSGERLEVKLVPLPPPVVKPAVVQPPAVTFHFAGETEHKPVYRKPAFWVAVGVLAIAATAGTIYLARPEEADVVLRWP